MYTITVLLPQTYPSHYSGYNMGHYQFLVYLVFTGCLFRDKMSTPKVTLLTYLQIDKLMYMHWVTDVLCRYIPSRGTYMSMATLNCRHCVDE